MSWEEPDYGYYEDPEPDEPELETEALGEEFPEDMYRLWMEAPLGDPPAPREALYV